MDFLGTILGLRRCRAMLQEDPIGLRRMADRCRTLASTRQTDELRNILMQMARRYDAEATEREASVGACSRTGPAEMVV